MTLRSSLSETFSRSTDPPGLLVVTDCHVGSTLATDMAAEADVRLVTDETAVADRVPDAVSATVGDVTERTSLQAAARADAAVVALRADRRALLATQVLRTRFDVGTIVVLLNDPHRSHAFEGLATEVVCASTHLSAELRGAVETSLAEAGQHA